MVLEGGMDEGDKLGGGAVELRAVGEELKVN